MTTGFRRIVSLSAVVLGLAAAGVSCGGGGAASPDGAAAAGTTGAGTGGTTGAGGTTGTTPVALCKQVVETFCNKLYTCPGVADGGATDIATCVTDYDVFFGCDRAGTTPGFDICLSDFKSESCATLFPVVSGQQEIDEPGSCTAPTEAIPATTAQQQCATLAETNCMRILTCMSDTSSDDLLSCEQEVASSCPFATAVGSTFETCETDLQNEPCSDFDADAGTTDDGGSSSGQVACSTAITFAD